MSNELTDERIKELFVQMHAAGDSWPQFARAVIKADSEQRRTGQTPVEVQYRMAPVWIDAATRWDGVVWEKCSPKAAADYERAGVVNDWEYQVRRLYTEP